MGKSEVKKTYWGKGDWELEWIKMNLNQPSPAGLEKRKILNWYVLFERYMKHLFQSPQQWSSFTLSPLSSLGTTVPEGYTSFGSSPSEILSEDRRKKNIRMKLYELGFCLVWIFLFCFGFCLVFISYIVEKLFKIHLKSILYYTI